MEVLQFQFVGLHLLGSNKEDIDVNLTAISWKDMESGQYWEERRTLA